MCCGELTVASLKKKIIKEAVLKSAFEGAVQERTLKKQKEKKSRNSPHSFAESLEPVQCLFLSSLPSAAPDFLRPQSSRAGSVEIVLVCWVFFPVFPCQPLTYCSSHCYALLAAIHAALERDDGNGLKLPVHSVRSVCRLVE